MRTKGSRFALILMSGGIDSTACAFLLRSAGLRVCGLHIDFGQAAQREEARACRSVARQLGMTILRLRARFPSARYGAGEVVGRNAYLLFSALMSGLIQRGVIATGIHSGTPYYDCSPRFFQQVNAMVSSYTSGAISVVAPFLRWTKSDIVNYCNTSGLLLDKTYSCEKGLTRPCGKCLSCRDRIALRV